MENLLQVKTNKFIRIDLDQMGELVQAIGGVSIQNANEFTAQGFKFPQGTVALNNTKEVAAYFTRLNTGDTKSFCTSARSCNGSYRQTQKSAAFN